MWQLLVEQLASFLDCVAERRLVIELELLVLAVRRHLVSFEFLEIVLERLRHVVELHGDSSLPLGRLIATPCYAAVWTNQNCAISSSWYLATQRITSCVRQCFASSCTSSTRTERGSSPCRRWARLCSSAMVRTAAVPDSIGTSFASSNASA